MKPKTFIAIGGCHVAGYGVGEQNSFINHFSKDFKRECLGFYSNFQIKYIHKIDKIIKQHDPEVVLLQLGNYEFHASLKKLFLNNKSKKNIQSSSGTKNKEIITTSVFKKINFPLPDQEQKSNNIFSSFLTFMIWRIIKKRNSAYMAQLKNIITSHPDRKFIFLSPLPCIKSNDREIRSKGGKLFKKMFDSIENITYVDLFSHIPPVRKYFKDCAHLNHSGHSLLAQAISKEAGFICNGETNSIAV